MIRFDNIAFRYDGTEHDVLRDISFTLEGGSYHFLSGQSGSGKTSLMSLLYLGHLATRGKMTMFGQNVNTLTRAERFLLRQQIGVVFQDFRLLNNLTTYENVALPLKIMKRPEAEIKAHVTELLDWVGLGEHKNHLPMTLSGGQQQRVAIARAVITRPRLLIADEPTGNLDDEIGYRLMGLFEQMNRMGTTILIATHNQQMIEQFGHPVLQLKSGRLLSEVEDDDKINIMQKIRHVF